MPSITEKSSLLGWLAFCTSLVIQLSAAVWVIASMNAAIAELKVEVSSIIEVQKTQGATLNSNQIDIRLLQQSIKR